ncbi:diguanylate cyclase domain-containing protein [Sphingomonas sp. MMS24-J13]|uniref:sensor domain-containing diguanylate cyclase n=1 Tax=Sphingomonas sp. MMS24-J13 TaxID=3238686 RepID=UPI00384FCA2D
MDRWQAASHQLRALQSEIDEARGGLDAAMQMVVEGALGAIPQAAGAIVEMRDQDALVYRAGSGIAATSMGLRLDLDNSLSGDCIRTGEPRTWSEGQKELRVDAEAGRRVGARSFVAVPLAFNGDNIGVLKIFSADRDAFEEHDLVLAQFLANAIILALASAERTRLVAEHDALARRFVATFDQAAVGIAHVAPDGHFLLVNQRFTEITGWGSDELARGGFQQITHPDDLEADLANLTALVAGEIPRYSMEKRYIRHDGTLVWVNLTVSLVRTADGQPDFFVSVIEDISARKAAEVLASHDMLTGLPNRRLVLDQLAYQLAFPTGGRPLAVAYLDVDRFKSVNDRFGHAEGDRCLVAISGALKGSLREGDLLGRMAGDEFVLILPDADAVAAEALLARLCDAVDRLPDRPRWNVHISAGAIIVSPGSGAEPDRVLHAADQLMYRVKHDHSGGSKVEHLAT